MSEILTNLYLGDINTAENNAGKNIIIINCAKEIESTQYDYKINLFDGSNGNDFEDEIEKAVKIIDEHMTNDKILLVHCMAGVSRSATVVIYYLMKYHNFTFDSALTHVKDKRPIVNINKWFYNWQ
jgi:protein-tyrosine phosphatase